MELIGHIGDEERRVVIDQREDGRFLIHIDGRELAVDCVEFAPDHYSLLLGDRSHEVRVHRDKNDRFNVHFFESSYQVSLMDPMQAALEGVGAGGPAGEAALEAPMPGQVLNILVKEGDEVAEDQGLLVLVAMKMENQLGSPKAGVVKQILVKEGDNVEGGAPLVVVA